MYQNLLNYLQLATGMSSTTNKAALRTVVVYCGGNLGNNEVFVKAAQGNSIFKVGKPSSLSLFF